MSKGAGVAFSGFKLSHSLTSLSQQFDCLGDVEFAIGRVDPRAGKCA
ncbi:MAG: hypothetical protein AAF636_24005 [Pseudomonadota bacterium]